MKLQRVTQEKLMEN